jgi:hypothetical protein
MPRVCSRCRRVVGFLALLTQVEEVSVVELSLTIRCFK